MMLGDDSYSGSIVSMLNISCDVSRYHIHDYCYPEMYRDTVFTIVIYPDMYHDTVSFVVSSRFSCALCFCGCTRASLVLFGFSNTRLSPDGSSQKSRSKVFNVETSQLEGISCHEWYSVLLGSTKLPLLVSIRWELGSFPSCRPGWKPRDLAVCIWTSLVV